jgi:gentisate 1,2-dioxygenase
MRGTRHDHGKDGSGPMIWLDALDLPLFQFFPVHFVEHFKEKRYPAIDVDSRESPIVFPWEAMKRKLDAKTDDWVAEEYRKANGSYCGSHMHCSRRDIVLMFPSEQNSRSVR